MNRLIFVGWTPGTLAPSLPIYELHQQGRFACSLEVEPIDGGARVHYAWTDNRGGFGSIDLPGYTGKSDSSRRRAIVAALSSAK